MKAYRLLSVAILLAQAAMSQTGQPWLPAFYPEQAASIAESDAGFVANYISTWFQGGIWYIQVQPQHDKPVATYLISFPTGKILCKIDYSDTPVSISGDATNVTNGGAIITTDDGLKIEVPLQEWPQQVVHRWVTVTGRLEIAASSDAAPFCENTGTSRQGTTVYACSGPFGSLYFSGVVILPPTRQTISRKQAVKIAESDAGFLGTRVSACPGDGIWHISAFSKSAKPPMLYLIATATGKIIYKTDNSDMPTSLTGIATNTRQVP